MEIFRADVFGVATGHLALQYPMARVEPFITGLVTITMFFGLTPGNIVMPILAVTETKVWFDAATVSMFSMGQKPHTL